MIARLKSLLLLIICQPRRKDALALFITGIFRVNLALINIKTSLFPAMNLTDIQSLARQDMTEVNDLIYSQLNSDVALINQLGVYIVNAEVASACAHY